MATFFSFNMAIPPKRHEQTDSQPPFPPALPSRFEPCVRAAIDLDEFAHAWAPRLPRRSSCPVRVVVALRAGSSTDRTGHLRKANISFKQPVVVDDPAGRGRQKIGRPVTKAAPDTLCHLVVIVDRRPLSVSSSACVVLCLSSSVRYVQELDDERYVFSALSGSRTDEIRPYMALASGRLWVSETRAINHRNAVLVYPS
jgi:hypothetical protein